MPDAEKTTDDVAVELPQSERVQNSDESRSTSGDVALNGDLDRVREILFGSQLRNYEKRFNHLEERLLKECTTLRDETRKRLDSLEEYLKKEVELLTAWLKSERAEREETVEELDRNLKQAIESLEKKIAALDEQTTQSERNLLQQALDLSKSLNNEMQRKSEEILSVVEQEAQKIRKDKTDRSTLVNLLTEMAMRLNNELDS